MNPRLYHTILAYGEKNLHEPISIRDISEEVGISYHYLQHQFRTSSHESLWQMVKRIRLEHAFGYLKHSGFQVSEIGDMVGYSTKHAFSKAFSQHFNHSPTQIRKKLDLIPQGCLGSFANPVFEAGNNSREIQLPEKVYYYKYYSPAPLIQGLTNYAAAQQVDESEVQEEELQPDTQFFDDVWDMAELLHEPIYFGSSLIGCATDLKNGEIRVGILLDAHDSRQHLLRKTGYFHFQMPASKYIFASYQKPIYLSGIIIYELIVEMIKKGYKVKHHNALASFSLAAIHEFQLILPVV